MQIAEHLITAKLAAARARPFAGEVRIHQILGLGVLAREHSRRISGKTLYASSRSASCREPDQTEFSFSTMRSSSTPPNIIAPSRPFPIGEDEVNSFAGASNQMVVSGDALLGLAALAGALIKSAPRIIKSDTYGAISEAGFHKI